MTPSQDAREAAAKLLETQNGPSLYAESVLRGEQDDGDAVQAFARFEAHLRSTSPAGEVGEIAAWAWLDEMVSALCDEDPSDLAYSADQMVDAFMAGQRLAASDTEAMRLLRELRGYVVAVVEAENKKFNRDHLARIDAFLAKGGAA